MQSLISILINICIISLHTKASNSTVLILNVLVKRTEDPENVTHTHTHTHFPKEKVEEISHYPSSSPFSFHFLYLPNGKQLTTITSPHCMHSHTHRLIFISLFLTLTNTQTPQPNPNCIYQILMNVWCWFATATRQRVRVVNRRVKYI